MFNKVFISYAREDFHSAENIYEHLEAHNFNPWMDKKKLLVGQRWENQIMSELRLADFIIILLSKVSVAKRGFVQREFKYALKYAEEKLNSDIFILPIKLDDCAVPEELGVFNWTEFNIESNNQIVQALNHQRNKRLEVLPKELISLNDFTENEVKIDGKINSLYDFVIKYPIFPETNTIDTEMFNIEIKHYVNSQISFLNKELFDEDLEDTFERIKEYGHKYSLDVSYSVGLVSKDFASILFYEFHDFLGAHPNHSWNSINVAFNPNRILSNRDFSNLDKLKDLIIKYKYEFDNVDSEIVSFNLEHFNEYSESDYFYPKEFEFFFLDTDTILINFSNHLPCLLYTSPSPRDRTRSRMPSSA